MAQKKKKTSPAAKPTTRKRALKQPQYKSFRLSKPIKYSGRPLPTSWHLLKEACRLLWRYKKPLAGILVIYGILQVVLVQGVLTSNFSDLKATFDDAIGGVGGNFATLSYMLSSIGQTNSAESSIYQSILFVVGSLAFIWALRQLMAGKQIRTRDAYYKGMYPLIPFILVLLVIGLQTIPALGGAWLYSVVVANGVATAFVEQLFWLIIFFIFALLSLYMICSSLFALYIVTLPDMTPMKALRSARELVLHQRWSVIRKLVLFVLAVLVIVALVMVPVIMVVPVLAPALFYTLTVLILGMAHAYIYTIYRELLLDE